MRRTRADERVALLRDQERLPEGVRRGGHGDAAGRHHRGADVGFGAEDQAAVQEEQEPAGEVPADHGGDADPLQWGLLPAAHQQSEPRMCYTR